MNSNFMNPKFEIGDNSWSLEIMPNTQGNREKLLLTLNFDEKS